MTDDHLKTLTTSVAAILIPFVLFVWLRRSPRWNCKIPICLPCGYLETTKQLASPNAPWFVLRWAKKIGFIFRIRIPNTKYIFMVGDPIIARDILLDLNATKPTEPLAGASTMFSSNGERFRHVRKSVALAFSSHHIKRMHQVCHAKLEEWIQNRLDAYVRSNQAMDPAKEMIALTLSIISESAFEYEVKEEEADDFIQELHEAMREYVMRQLYNPFRRTWLGRCLFHRQIQRGKLAAEQVQAFCRKLLENYRHKRNSENYNTSNGSVNSNNKRPNIRTIIECIDSDDQYANDQERIADIFVFFVGGFDSTAYTLAWTLLELARNPQHVEQVRKELQPMLPEERPQAPALRNFVREAMRIHPVFALSPLRQVHRDIKVNDDTIIPKGSKVFMPSILLSRNPQIFEEPDVFCPDRWGWSSKSTTTTTTTNNTTATTSSPTSLAFMPFAVGPRNCVGQALADAELHTVVSRLVMEYDFQVQDVGRADFFLSLKPIGLRLKVQKRQNFISE